MRVLLAILLTALLLVTPGCVTVRLGGDAAKKPVAPAARQAAEATAPASESVEVSTPVEIAPDPGADKSALRLPPMGDPERKAVLDALRVVVEADLGQKVVFKVDRLAVHGDFAYVAGKPLNPDETAIDYRKTKYADAVDAGAFDDGVFALLKREAGAWRVLESAIGATDFPSQSWVEQHKAPADLLGG